MNPERIFFVMLTGANITGITATDAARYPQIPAQRTAAATSYPTTPQAPWIGEVRAQVSALADLGPDWTSYHLERPSSLAVAVALEIVEAAANAGHRPAYVVPSADGGASLRFSHDERSAIVEVTNAGEIAFMLQFSSEAEPDFVDVERADASERLVSFLG